MNFEFWRPVRGYVGLYLVSNRGRIKNQKTGRILKPSIQKDGYLQVQLRNDGIKSTWLVHRLVIAAFKYDCPPGFEVDHIDFNPENNSIDNLRYLPISVNRARKSKEWREKNANALKKQHSDPEWLKKHADAMKELSKRKEWRDNVNKRSKPVNQYTLDGEFIKTWPSAREIERELGIKPSNICLCCKGIKKSAGGSKWKHAS